MRRLTRLILDDMRPALGVTEPAAIAFAVAKAKTYAPDSLVEVRVTLNSGMYKNAFTCGIPNSRETGNLYAAALGYIAADASKGLECLSTVKAKDTASARRLIGDGLVKVFLGEVNSRIHIKAEVVSSMHRATVTILGSHTNIANIEVDGYTIYESDKARHTDTAQEAKAAICKYRLADIVRYINCVNTAEIGFIAKAFDLNLALYEKALASPRLRFTRRLWEANGRQTISADAHKTAALLAAAAIEARVAGLDAPAMSVTGSGAHGIIATLPLYAAAKASGRDKDTLLRATALSILVCMYIKEHSGRLSAFCGCAIAAGTGMACGLVRLQGGGWKEMELAIRNMASSITGMICDGGNQGCTMKGITAVDAAFRASEFAMAGIAVDSKHGINGCSPELTMRNMGRIASPGMVETERTILDIMVDKRL